MQENVNKSQKCYERDNSFQPKNENISIDRNNRKVHKALENQEKHSEMNFRNGDEKDGLLQCKNWQRTFLPRPFKIHSKIWEKYFEEKEKI